MAWAVLLAAATCLSVSWRLYAVSGLDIYKDFMDKSGKPCFAVRSTDTSA